MYDLSLDLLLGSYPHFLEPVGYDTALGIELSLLGVRLTS